MRLSRSLGLFSLLFSLSCATGYFRGEPEAVLTEKSAWPWERIERHFDPHPKLPVEKFHEKLGQFYPQIIEAFNSKTPSSGKFLLHFAPGWDQAKNTTPVLLIPGANDDATRRYALPESPVSENHLKTPGLMQYLSARGMSVFAVSFSHYHGDNLYQGEAVANAIQRIRQVLGRSEDAQFKVSLVTFSKGAMAARAYVQSAGDYYHNMKHLTKFRNDVNRVVFQGGPIAGLDTPFRYYLYNLTLASQNIPAPMGASEIVLYGLFKSTGDNYIGSGCWAGQLQMLQDQRELGIAYGPLSWTTDMNYTATVLRDGGSSLFVKSNGLDYERKRGGRMIEILNDQGFPKEVEFALLAGNNPVLYDERYPELKLPAGAELSAPSDGLVYVASATYEQGLNAQGAKMIGKKILPLNHIDLSRSKEAFEFVADMLSR